MTPEGIWAASVNAATVSIRHNGQIHCLREQMAWFIWWIRVAARYWFSAVRMAGAIFPSSVRSGAGIVQFLHVFSLADCHTK